ncbi:Alpha-1,2-mannosyltransferase MNN21 [Neolecta irregularis DAH-3]|uniref:Alpha-1,2-mannosyltransferase MNN21 n=1 Tax=Neolecta irregularis (strain DAH-3) TaxID=1198029 RepID=A0A1U7LHT0_NEOID|nr:Alpha-1,2-mannosyltransferase MNN21 [Neolecta irregularis DAH-3]|eukprot:OLL22204.1 Alpha-1,2-mannosyltransferase MNN21 [Neolecta irregularis DAH-3]
MYFLNIRRSYKRRWIILFLAAGLMVFMQSLCRHPTRPTTPTIELWKTLVVLYESHTPVPSFLKLTSNATAIRYDIPETTHEELNQGLLMQDNEVLKTKKIHASLLGGIPPYPDIFRGDGIVILGGGVFYMKIALLSLRLLRRTGSRLPVEMWFEDDEEFDDILCAPGSDFEQMNVECRVISHIISKVPTKVRMETYQLKALALIFSNFERVLLLDSDNIPAHDPQVLFDSSPFIESKVVAWPDFWHATVSKYYYQIVNISQESAQDTMESRRSHRKAAYRTVESGQLMWDKRHRWKSLVLVLYYNVYGPTFFYNLFSLGAKGQGDKETWLMACRAAGEDFYMVDQEVRSLGWWNGNEFKGTAMAQSDPRDDIKTLRNENFEVGRFFLHANYPKLNAIDIIEKNTFAIDARTQQRRRMWGGVPLELFEGRDLEKEAWKEMLQIECESHLQNPLVCKIMEEHFDAVFNT